MSRKNSTVDPEMSEAELDELDELDAEELDEDGEEGDEPQARKSRTAGRTEKRCAKHHVNFPDEEEVRPISEFYGKAQSSYCKKCMGIVHKERRQRLGGSTSKRGASINALVGAVREQAEAVVSNEISGNREDAWQYFTDNIQDAFYAYLDSVATTATPEE